MKKWVIVASLGALVALVAAAVGFALVGNGSPASQRLVGEHVGNGTPVRSDEGIGSDECSWVHNILACERQLAQKATEDLARRLGIDASGVKLVSREMAQWPDASLGNPQPGMVYAQVVTSGYKILLRAGDKTYEYHADLGERVELVG